MLRGKFNSETAAFQRCSLSVANVVRAARIVPLCAEESPYTPYESLRRRPESLRRRPHLFAPRCIARDDGRRDPQRAAAVLLLLMLCAAALLSIGWSIASYRANALARSEHEPAAVRFIPHAADLLSDEL